MSVTIFDKTIWGLSYFSLPKEVATSTAVSIDLTNTGFFLIITMELNSGYTTVID